MQVTWGLCFSHHFVKSFVQPHQLGFLLDRIVEKQRAQGACKILLKVPGKRRATFAHKINTEAEIKDAAREEHLGDARNKALPEAEWPGLCNTYSTWGFFFNTFKSTVIGRTQINTFLYSPSAFQHPPLSLPYPNCRSSQTRSVRCHFLIKNKCEEWR